jgi:hypothetical protein
MAIYIQLHELLFQSCKAVDAGNKVYAKAYDEECQGKLFFESHFCFENLSVRFSSLGDWFKAQVSLINITSSNTADHFHLESHIFR